jgi:hypothetical protein
MMRRVVRVVVRLAGWLLTPLVLTLAAFLGATIMAMVAPVVSTAVAMALVTLAGSPPAPVGLWLWIRLLRGSPVLRRRSPSPRGRALEAEVDAMLGTAEQPGVP